jgi:hypothetical protein
VREVHSNSECGSRNSELTGSALLHGIDGRDDDRD